MHKYYNIAALNVLVEKPGHMLLQRGKKYEVSTFDCPDVIIPYDSRPIPEKYVNEEELSDVVVYMREHTVFYKKLIDYNGFLLHASAVALDNYAYLFSAPCGTGKSTHVDLWIKKFGERAFIINDDKPAIRIINNTIYAFGTPWSGKNDISENKGIPLKGICFLQRDKKNWIKESVLFDSAVKIMNATIKNLTKQQIDKLLNNINFVINNTKIYDMGCTPTLEAVEVAYNLMKE